MRDFGGRGAAGSDGATAFGWALLPRGPGGGSPADSSLPRCLPGIGSAGYRPELLKGSSLLTCDLAHSCLSGGAFASLCAGHASSAGPKTFDVTLGVAGSGVA